MHPNDNPLLQPEDFTADYKENIEKLRHDPSLVSFDKICYEVFSTPVGKQFMEMVAERYLIPPMADRNSPNFSTNCVWAEGFKDFGRMLRLCIISHDQRIKAEINK